jgi:hypothetical protein
VNLPILAMIYGQPGVGKTTLALSAPNPVLIDADIGLHRVEERFHCPAVRIFNHEELFDALNSEEIREFSTIIFDTVGKIVNNIVDDVRGSNPRVRQSDGTISLKGWGAVKVKFQELMRIIINLGKDVIFLAHAREVKDGEATFFRPDICGSSGTDIIQDMDLLGYMQMQNHRRTISFSPDDKYFAKNSLGLDPVIEVTSTEKGNTFFTDKIIREVIKKRERGHELAREYCKLKESQGSRIQDVQTLKDLNTAYAILNKEEKIWDSESCWKRLLNEKCKSLGASFDGEAKAFVAAANQAA